MSKKRFDSKPFDSCHSIMFNAYPLEYTSLIGVPGVFVKKINRKVHLNDGTSGTMDSAYIAEPDYRLLFEMAAVDLEHQSIPVDDYKLLKIGDYDVQLVVDEQLPTLMAIASHINEEKSKNELVRSPSDITKPYFLDLGEENIYKRLNTVRGIINSNNEISTKDALNLGIILLYAPRDCACEITEEVIELYLNIVDDLDFKMNCMLYSVMTTLVDAYFESDNEYWRLMNMINNGTSKGVIEECSPFSGFKEDIMYLKEDIEELEAKNAELEAEKSELEAKINELESKLNGK